MIVAFPVLFSYFFYDVIVVIYFKHIFKALELGFMTFKVSVETVIIIFKLKAYILFNLFRKKIIKILNKNRNICDLNFI